MCYNIIKERKVIKMFSKSELNLLREIICYYLNTFTFIDEESEEWHEEFLKPVKEIDNKIEKMLDKQD